MLTKRKKLTKQSGVYLFKNKDEQIIYIGKAKNIADRIASYFANPDDFKNSLILQEATDLQTIPTSSEEEALYLEVDLIKKYQPKFNQLLKDGNPFIYLYFSDEKATRASSFQPVRGEAEKYNLPTLSVVRIKTKKKTGTYIGPFLTKKAARAVFDYVMKTFQLKLCKKKIEHGCLEFHIGVCAGYCSLNFDLKFYKFRLKLAQYLISKEPDRALKDIDKEIKDASKNLQFEKARNLLEYKKNLEQFAFMIEKLSNMPSKQKNPDQAKNLSILLAMQQRLYLEHVPYVIDCFDISHMQGHAIVGSCIRYVNGQPEPKSFRRFQLKTLIGQDDCAALVEIVQRRYKTGTDYPNLVIVDGGKGQINAIKKFVGTAELVGLAKREETIISQDFSKFIQLDNQRPEDALILQIRDKTHQFAVSYHRKKMTLSN
jgi:excinuclease ABC subunit C